MSSKRLFQLFATFFKIGMFTIGGGYVMLAFIHDEFVERKKWVTSEKMVDIIAVSQALPGVIAINSSVYIGYEVCGVVGAVIAGIGVILPSFLIILAVFFLLNQVGENVFLSRFYTGVRASIVALLITTGLKLAKSAVKNKFGVALALFSVIATVLKVDIIVIVLISALSGLLYYYVFRKGTV